MDPDLGVEELLNRLNKGVLTRSSESGIEIKFGAAVAADDAFIYPENTGFSEVSKFSGISGIIKLKFILKLIIK